MYSLGYRVILVLYRGCVGMCSDTWSYMGGLGRRVWARETILCSVDSSRSEHGHSNESYYSRRCVR